MYVPRSSLLNLDEKNTGPAKKRRPPSPYRSKYGMLGAALVLVVLLLIAALLQKNDPNNQTLAAKPMTQDLTQLWSWNDQLLEGGAENAEWSIRWDAAISPDIGIAGVAAELFVNSKGEASEKLVTQGGQSITGPYPASWNGRLSLHETEQTDGGVSIIVMLEKTEGSVSMEQLQAAGERVADAIAKYTADGKVTLKSHGYSRLNNPTRELARIAMGRIMEQYEDGGTRSVTMLTDKLLVSQKLDGYRSANLQAAEHRNTENGKLALTIGVPLLSGEFGAADGQP